jgi:hypothetical protein
MAASEVHSRTVTIDEARRAVLVAMRSKRPVFLWGPPGIGKSDLVQQIADELHGLLIDIRLPLLDPTDVKGMPYFDQETKRMRWAPPNELPTAEQAAKYPVIVLFLDEMNAAAQSVQASAYQLTLNRRIGEYRLPDNVVIVAAGNRDNDRGVTFRMPSPLANRFIHLEIRPDFDCWNRWAVNNDIHPDVVGYLNFAKSDLYDFRPDNSSRAFATARSWAFVSQLIQDPTVDSNTVMELVAGSIGESLAIKFMAHRKFCANLPNPEDILTGRVKSAEVKETSAQYSLATNMCYELKDYHTNNRAKLNVDKWHEMVDNFFRFAMNHFTSEVVILSVKVAIAEYKIPFQGSKMKTYPDFIQRYGKYVTAALQV